MPPNVNSPFFLSSRTQILFRVAICPGKRIFSQLFFLCQLMKCKRKYWEGRLLKIVDLVER